MLAPVDSLLALCDLFADRLLWTIHGDMEAVHTTPSPMIARYIFSDRCITVLSLYVLTGFILFLEVPPHAFNSPCVCPSFFIDKFLMMVH